MSKLAPETPIEVWFQDEMRVGQKNSLVYQWAKKGSRAAAWLKTFNADNVSDLFTTLGGQLIHRLFLLFFSLLALFALLRHGPAVASRVLETCDRLFGEAKASLRRWWTRRVRP